MTHTHLSNPTHPCRPFPRLWWIVALLAVLAAAGYAVFHPSSTLPIRMRHELDSFFTKAPVLLLGDSISYANSPQSLCGQEVFNAAVPGAKLDDILGQGVRLADRIRPHQVVVAIGVNDATVSHESIAEWREHYRQLLAALNGADITVVEVNPVDTSFPAVAHAFDLSFIALQNKTVRELAAAAGARVVHAPATAKTADGLHPDEVGGLLWRERLARTACAG